MIDVGRYQVDHVDSINILRPLHKADRQCWNQKLNSQETNPFY